MTCPALYNVGMSLHGTSFTPPLMRCLTIRWWQFLRASGAGNASQAQRATELFGWIGMIEHGPRDASAPETIFQALA